MDMPLTVAPIANTAGMKTSSKVIIFIIIAVILLVILAVIFYWKYENPLNIPDNNQ